MNAITIQQNLQSLKNEVRQLYKAELKGIFGSFATGKAREDSDIDILVDFEKEATLLDLTGLGNFLEEKLHRKIDIVTTAALRKELRTQILGELVAV
jgi:predicted nucleotidyltransferase